MEGTVDVLIVSSRIENRRTLLRALEGLPVSPFCASTIEQAVEVLVSHPMAVIVCDERVPDGSYRELLNLVLAQRPLNRFVVVLNTEEWKDYMEALKIGVVDVLRCPLQATDIDIALTRAMREGRLAIPMTA